MTCAGAGKKPKPEFPPLLPAGLHVLDALALFRLTVGNFKTSAKRPVLWASLMKFCEELRDEGIIPCNLWLDGSFLTEKVEPDDIDLIVELDNSIYSKLRMASLAYFQRLSSQPLHVETRCLHTFLMIKYPILHIDHAFSLAVRKQWEYDFGHALLSKTPKGIVILEVGP